MGWTSTGDPYANVGEAGLEFDSAEAAKVFAEKHGWEYQVCAYCLWLILLFYFTFKYNNSHNNKQIHHHPLFLLNNAFISFSLYNFWP